MPRYPWHLLHALARSPVVGEYGPLTDAELLARFARGRDQAAFEVLVWRHGPMVAGVCRRVLADRHAAEDAFQATFLVLARKAGSVRTAGSAAGWLHRVARRVAVRAAKRAAARRESGLTVEPPARPAEPYDPALRAVLDEEIDRLPERLRLPVVLCYLNGRSTEDAARVLGVPRGTVLSRLSAARTRLADRLTRRGVAAPAALTATAAWTAGLSADSVRGVVAGLGLIFHPESAGPATPAYLLAQEVLRMSAWQKIAGAAAAVLLAAGVGTGVVVVAGDGPGVLTTQTELPPPAAKERPEPKPVRPEAPPVAPKGDARPSREKLDKALHQIDDEIRAASDNKRRADLDLDVANEVGIRTLQDALAKLDATILEAESSVQSAQEYRDTMKRATLAPVNPPKAQQISQMVDNHSLVKNQLYELEKEESQLLQLRVLSEADSPKVIEAEATRDKTAKQVEKARSLARPLVEKTIDNLIANQQKAVTEADESLDEAKRILASCLASRHRLLKRISWIDAANEKAQMCQDRLRVLRDIRPFLLRQQILADIGVEGMPASNRQEFPERDDRLDQLARELADIKASLRFTDGKDKFELLQQSLEEMKSGLSQLRNQGR